MCDELKEVQIKEFPDSVIITHEELAAYHEPDIAKMIMDYKEVFVDSVAYYLPKGKYGATDHCNGVRYGADGDYLSLPHIMVDQNQSNG